MFLLNSGRYIVADPVSALKEDTFKRLLETSSRLNSYTLKTDFGLMVAFPVLKNGEFKTDMGKVISTESAHIAFLPYLAAEKLLPYGVIRLNLQEPALLFFDADRNIVLDGKLTIYR